ncbi:hypothetical protein EV426DRAFT_712796 [Tirmania nivea]|nr:hypothetical protein EV426DRAFT_712796 [Tirmania nivea]
MPAFGDSYRTNNPYQQKAFLNKTHHHQLQNSQRFVSPPEGASSLSPPAPGQTLNKAVSSQLSTVLGVGSGGAGGNYKHKIYPKEFPNTIFKSTQTATASPLLAAIPNPSDLFARSFLSASPGTSSTAPSSVTGGSPPSSWPASYTNNGSLPRGIGGSVPRNGGYPSFEEHLSRNGAFTSNQRHTASSGDAVTLRPGDASYACSFDTLDGESENVLCFGWEGGLDVWRAGKGSLDLLGRLEGLSGGVRSAKILPTPQRGDPLASIRPLVVLTIQTPVQTTSQDDLPSPTTSSPPSPRPQSAASFSSSHSHHMSHGPKHSTEIEWQTSVEIYSLSTRERVTVLLTSPLEPSPVVSTVDLTPPPVWGGLRVEVGDKSIAVGVGLSGEVYLFTLVTVVSPVQVQSVVPPITMELAQKGKRGKTSCSQKKSPAPVCNPLATGFRGEWVCQGKVWTTVQIPTGGAEGANSSYTGGGGNSGLGFFQNGTPVFSLEGRWLSYSPPPANSSISAGVIVRVSHGLAASSLMAQTPLSQPPITAQVDTADGEEKLINRMAREATQEVIRGAKWVGGHGIKAWQSYWSGVGPHVGSGPQSTQPANSLPSSLNGGSGNLAEIGSGAGSVSGMSALGQQLQRERQMQQMTAFPSGMGSPYLSSNGNAYANTTTSTVPSNGVPLNIGVQHQSGGYVKSAMHSGNDPIYVSVLDLGKFPSSVDSQVMPSSGYQQCTPFATFQPPLGASYLSFAPGGLALLTVSGKGDVYSVWDLMRVVHKPTSSNQGHNGSSVGPSSSVGPASNLATSRHVRLVARFTRMTVARTVDVTWSFPRGDKLAVITDRGTVHFYDLPNNAYQWPPYRKPPPSSASTNVSPVFNSQQAAGVVQAMQGAVSLLGSSTQPLLTAARRRRSSNSAKLPSPTGGIFVNYGDSRARESTSEGAGSSGGSKGSYIPTGVSKVSLPGNPATVAPGLVKFFVGKDKGKVAMMGGGLLFIYQNTTGNLGGSKKRRGMANGGILLESGVAYDLPGLPDNLPTINRDHNDGDQLIELDKVVSGYWNGKTHHNARLSDAQYRKRDEQQQYIQHPLSFAEIETTPAYPAFHTDRRVTLMVFSDISSTVITSSMPMKQRQMPALTQFDTVREDAQTDKHAKWVFGFPIKTEKLNLGGGKGDVEFLDGGALEDVADAIESSLKSSAHFKKDGEEGERVVVKSRRKKRGKNPDIDGIDVEEGFFEEDCVLDFPAGT